MKAFEKIYLEAGATQEVAFTLTYEEMGYCSNQGYFIIEPGSFDVMVDGSSASGLAGSFVGK